jgi:tetratricopeptide (TPR) repeat protein
LLRPQARWGERFFSFSDIVAVETITRLTALRIPAGRLRRAIDALETGLVKARGPLSSLRISSNGSRIVVHEPGPAGRPFEPLSGQWVLDFQVAPIERKVHALGHRTAEEWFELAMSFDANAETLPQAAEAYRRAIDALPGWVEAHINLGTALYQMGKKEEAGQIFASAVKIDPGSALAHFNLGCVHESLGKTTDAIEEFRAALARSSQMADAHLNLALAYDKSGNKSGAQRHFSLYLRFDPNGPWAEYSRKCLGAIIRSSHPDNSGKKVTPFRSVGR